MTVDKMPLLKIRDESGLYGGDPTITYGIGMLDNRKRPTIFVVETDELNPNGVTNVYPIGYFTDEEWARHFQQFLHRMAGYADMRVPKGADDDE